MLMNRPSSDRNPFPDIHLTLDHQIVLGRPASHDDLVNELAAFPRNELLVVLSNLNHLVDGFALVGDPRVQLPLITNIGGSSTLARRIQQAFTVHRGSVFIFPEQLSSLCKFALLYSRAEKWPEDTNERLLRAMLVYNYLYGKESEADPNASEDERLLSLVKLEIGGAPNQDDRLQNIMVRYEQFFEWARSDTAKISPNYCDVDTDFQRFAGMTVDEYTTAIFSVLAIMEPAPTFENLNPMRSPISLAKVHSSFTVPAFVRRWIEDHSNNANDVALEYSREQPLRYTLASLHGLLKKPLVQIDDDHFVAPSRNFLENALGSAIFFTLLDGYNAENQREQAKRFTRFFGEFFEQYGLAIARAFGARSKSLCFGELLYRDDKSTDIVLFEGERAVFIEVVSKRFNLLASVVSRDPASIQNDLEDMIIDKAVQLERCVKDFRSEKLIFDGVQQRRIRKIYPVVLVVQPMSMSYGVRILINKLLKQKNLLQTTCPLEVMEIGTFESLEPALGRGIKLSTFLNAKMKHKVGCRVSVKNYIFHYLPELHETMARQRDRSLLAYRHAAWFKRACDLVKTWGIRED